MEEIDRSVLKVVFRKDIEFKTGSLPDSSQITYQGCLYNTSEFIKSSSGKEPIVFSIIHKIRKSILAQCKFTISEGVAYSPEVGPFGSLEMDPSLDPEILMDFISYFEKILSGLEIYQISIKNHASFQAPANCAKLQKAFLEMNYKTNSVDINHHIDISDQFFSSFIHPMEKRRLEKASKMGLLVRQANFTEMGSVHDFIRGCRNEKGLEINIGRDRFLEIIDQMPEHYHVFVGIIDSVIAVASVCVRVNSDILYNYLPASAAKYNSFSPMVMLMEYIYKFSQGMNFKFIDLGISSIYGKPQEGLIRFKERIGGQLSEKITYGKSLND